MKPKVGDIVFWTYDRARHVVNSSYVMHIDKITDGYVIRGQTYAWPSMDDFGICSENLISISIIEATPLQRKIVLLKTIR